MTTRALAQTAGTIVCCLLLVQSSMAGGYEFSISASDTDPFVNSSAKTDSLRSIYLWATCVEEGMSGVEAGVSSTGSLLGFTPLNGVLNMGASTDLRLVVGDCVYGAELNFLLGFWTVIDDGVDVCLTSSTANGILGAVDCEEFLIANDPGVIGFSSSGAPPCTTGTNVCSSQSGGSHGALGT